jgi:sulfur-carrier protein adenylyltransferase/sulfurtransferase
MYPWFFTDPGRLARERDAIEELENSAGWLVGTSWSLDEGLSVDVIIRAHDHDYPVRLIYPRFFPAVPPIVRPLEADQHWSSHQYGGADGALCLEWGPDNWHPEVTGAQMLESAYRLLYAENPLAAERPERTMTVPSRHQLAIGQEVRGSRFRVYIGHELGTFLERLPDHTSGILKFSVHARKESWLALIHELRSAEGTAVWSDASIPAGMRGRDDGLLRPGVFFKTGLDPALISGADGFTGLKDVLSQEGCALDILDEHSGAESDAARSDRWPFGVLIVDRANTPHLFIVFDDDSTLELSLVRSEVAARASRRPDEYTGLAARSVAVIGLGSAGGKIAVTLARMGVGGLFLVDHDLFFPENIERHVLDWAHVGDHKVDGVHEVLSRIRADLQVEVSRLHLTGQESAAAVSGVMNRIGRCDLLIDATASPNVFNLLAAVARAAQKPLVWTEVYAGGLGGMMARSRPGRDPAPQTMRAIYHHYCLEHPAPELRITGDYTAGAPEGQVLVASDADVSIIVHHAARLAVDTLLGRDPSVFPYSMYLIGLAKWWVFEAPFHTIPIDTDGVDDPEVKTEASVEEKLGSLEFIAGLLEKGSDAAPPSA